MVTHGAIGRPSTVTAISLHSTASSSPAAALSCQNCSSYYDTKLYTGSSAVRVTMMVAMSVKVEDPR